MYIGLKTGRVCIQISLNKINNKRKKTNKCNKKEHLLIVIKSKKLTLLSSDKILVGS